jgi:hypothetical protein
MTLLRRFSLCGAVLALAGQALMAHDPHDPINAIAVSPNFAQDGTVFAATEALTVKNGTYVVLKSTDAGLDFTPVPNIQNCDTVRKIVFSPAYAQDETVYVAGHGGLMGLCWRRSPCEVWRSLQTSPRTTRCSW